MLNLIILKSGLKSIAERNKMDKSGNNAGLNEYTVNCIINFCIF